MIACRQNQTGRNVMAKYEALLSVIQTTGDFHGFHAPERTASNVAKNRREARKYLRQAKSGADVLWLSKVGSYSHEDS